MKLIYINALEFSPFPKHVITWCEWCNRLMSCYLYRSKLCNKTSSIRPVYCFRRLQRRPARFMSQTSYHFTCVWIVLPEKLSHPVICVSMTHHMKETPCFMTVWIWSGLKRPTLRDIYIQPFHLHCDSYVRNVMERHGTHWVNIEMFLLTNVHEIKASNNFPR